MKVPDKIYLAENDKKAGETNISFWSLTPFSNHRSIKYIRKDALLEWTKEHKRVIEIHGDERDAYLQGEYSVLNSLIDKLNSM